MELLGVEIPDEDIARMRNRPDPKSRQKRYYRLYYERHRDEYHERYLRRRADPEKREHDRQVRTSPEAAARRRERQRERYATDPEYRERRKRYALEQMRRYATDPEYRERRLRLERERYAANREEINERRRARRASIAHRNGIGLNTETNADEQSVPSDD